MGTSDSWMRTSMTQSGPPGGKRRVWRVLIVDDHPIFRQGMRQVIESEEDLTVCAEAETAEGARAAIEELNPDALIVDISLKHGDLIDLVRRVRAHHHLPILVLSTYTPCSLGHRHYSVAVCIDFWTGSGGVGYWPILEFQ